MVKFEIITIQPGQIIGERIMGYVNLTITKPTKMKDLNLYIKGQTHTYYTETHYRTKTDSKGKTYKEKVIVTKNVDRTFYTSNYFKVFDEKHQPIGETIQEFAPGKYSYPFIFSIDKTDLPTTVIFPNNSSVWLKYFMYVELIEPNGNKITSSGHFIPMCITTNTHVMNAQRFIDNSSKANIELILNDKTPCIGQQIDCQLKCTNNCGKELKLRLEIETTHQYNNTTVHQSFPIHSFSPIESNELSNQSFKLTIPTNVIPTVQAGDFSVTNRLKCIGKYGIFQLDLVFPIEIKSDILDPFIQSDRCKVFGSSRDFTKEIGFYGSHYRQPPDYHKIIDKSLPLGIEKMKTRDDITFYVSHFSRQTSLTPDMTTPCDIPYPLYIASQLPQGISIGSEFGEMYFINHNNQTTSWNDPRINEDRFVPHIRYNKKAVFEVEIIKAVGLSVMGMFCPDPYGCIWDDKGKWISTEVIPNSLDPVFSSNKKLKIQLEQKRSNAVVYFYDRNRLSFDTFIGGVSFDFQYFPYDVEIKDWFTLSSFGDNHTPVTGKVLMKVCYKVGLVEDIPKVNINGKSSVNEDYYPDTHLLRNQIKKQNQMRQRKGMNENVMKVIDDKIVCVDY